jgi:protease I
LSRGFFEPNPFLFIGSIDILKIEGENMSGKIEGKKVAFLATDGFEQIELTRPWEAVEQEGGEPILISIEDGEIKGFHHTDKGDCFNVDAKVSDVNAVDYQALVLPGGVHNPDTLRTNKEAVQFVRDFFEQHKPVAAICHGIWLLVEADVVRNRTVTSWPSLQTDVRNAGGNWVDEECVCDEALVTSRKPDDLDAFCAKMIEEICEGKHEEQVADAA